MILSDVNPPSLSISVQIIPVIDHMQAPAPRHALNQSTRESVLSKENVLRVRSLEVSNQGPGSALGEAMDKGE